MGEGLSRRKAKMYMVGVRRIKDTGDTRTVRLEWRSSRGGEWNALGAG